MKDEDLRVKEETHGPRIKLPHRERTGSSTSFIVSFQSLLPATNSEKQHHHHHRQASLQITHPHLIPCVIVDAASQSTIIDTLPLPFQQSVAIPEPSHIFQRI
eukprot:scaffold470_cov276-Chaetoceros_neogracile.AAC.3